MAPPRPPAIRRAVVLAVNLLPAAWICLVTDRRRLLPHGTTGQQVDALERFLEEAVDSGVEIIQVRERDLDAGVLCRLVRRAVERAAGRDVRIVVNDRADVALAARAQGVHLRADGVPVAGIRQLAPDWFVGRSVHVGSPSEPDADYLLFGTVYGTTSKPGVTPAGLAPLTRLAASVRQPVLAIGGITPERAAECRRAGAAGIAAIGAFLPEGREPEALGVAAAVRAFRAALGGAVSRPRAQGSGPEYNEP